MLIHISYIYKLSFNKYVKVLATKLLYANEIFAQNHNLSRKCYYVSLLSKFSNFPHQSTEIERLEEKEENKEENSETL